MKHFARLRNTMRHYPWGSASEMSRILGKEAGQKPEAELWMGAHPSAPSLVEVGNDQWRPLDELIKEAPEETLGAEVHARFGSRLPFLFKVLAAGQPLSLQAHPSKTQAEDGFKRENKAGIPLDAPNRSYRDDNHKPEIICALTPFWALRGFRPHDQIKRFLAAVDSPVIAEPASAFCASPDREPLEELFGAIMKLPPDQQDQLVQDVVTYAQERAHRDPDASWLLRLHRFYPGDIGVAGAALLNLVCLEPGQAMYLPAGELHAYLSGVGIELMANSDNVLRGGLTPKHVDVEELQKTLTFEAKPVEIVSARQEWGGEGVYETPSPEFRLSTISINDHVSFSSGARRSVEIHLCQTGQICCTGEESGQSITLQQGESMLLPAAGGSYRLTGHGTLFRAQVPV